MVIARSAPTSRVNPAGSGGAEAGAVAPIAAPGRPGGTGLCKGRGGVLDAGGASADSVFARGAGGADGSSEQPAAANNHAAARSAAGTAADRICIRRMGTRLSDRLRHYRQ